MSADLILAHAAFYIVIFTFGSVVASFLNVVIYRLPKKISFVKGRSRCFSCGRTLMPLDMVPVFSYIFLRGHCHYCGSRFSPRYLFVELLGGVLSVGTYLKYGGHIFLFFAVFAFICGLIIAAFIDIDTMTIPDSIVIYLLIPAFALFFLLPDVSMMAHVTGAFSLSVLMFLMALAIPGSFGGGDIKLIAVCGLALGWKLTLFAGFAAVLTGGAYAAYLIISKKIKRGGHIFFGPFISFGVALAFFAGSDIINWYISLF